MTCEQLLNKNNRIPEQQFRYKQCANHIECIEIHASPLLPIQTPLTLSDTVYLHVLTDF